MREGRCDRCATGRTTLLVTGTLVRGVTPGRRVTQQFCGGDKCFAGSRLVPGAVVGFLEVETVEPYTSPPGVE